MFRLTIRPSMATASSLGSRLSSSSLSSSHTALSSSLISSTRTAKRWSSASTAGATAEQQKQAAQPDRLHGSIHWNYERVLCLGLLPVTGYALAYGAHPMNDLALSVLIPLHSHLGFGAVITDYLPKRKMPGVNTVTVWALRLATLGVILGCWKLNTQDVGITETVRRLWHARSLKNNNNTADDQEKA